MVTAVFLDRVCNKLPEFKEGEIVTVNPHVEALPGDFVIVKNDEEEATFKQLKIYGETTVLHPVRDQR